MSAPARRHESPELGDAIARMLRGLVTRAAEGDLEALEQLARIERLAPAATTLALGELHTWQPAKGDGYSFTMLADTLGVSRQAVRQRAAGAARLALGIGHVLVPGHSKRGCSSCQLGATA